MPKVKTHSGTKDRTRLTKSGKVLVKHPNNSHNFSTKSEARKRTLVGVHALSGKVKRNLKVKLAA